jgi:hypothetical protein
VLRLLGDADVDVAAGGAVRVEGVEEADPRARSRSNDTGELLFFQRFRWRCPWANADDESSPNASTISRRFFILTVRLTDGWFKCSFKCSAFNARLCRNELPEQARRDK